jgi:ADP-L-glycero-D-manno-heptose 6-epimerase
MIAVTGAAGFIGSHVALYTYDNFDNQEVVLVDHEKCFQERTYLKSIEEGDGQSRKTDAEEFLTNLNSLKDVSLVIHMGAISSTAEKDLSALKKWNVDYSLKLWEFCARRKIPFIYASSAATYGNGNQGFSDSHDKIPLLKPLNAYGQSKQDFDILALQSKEAPPHWYGLKFFNVYGPHEDHKARMASSIWHGYHEIKESGKMTLFRSHNPKFADGTQARDFIFVGDVIKVIDFLLETKPANGIYNCGTGSPTTFLELSKALDEKMDAKSQKKGSSINWIDTPLEFREGYQYETKADLTKLRSVGFDETFMTLKEGVGHYLDYLRQI